MCEFGEMNETVDIFLESYECAVVRETHNRPCYFLANWVAFRHFLPWVICQLFHTEGKLVTIDANHFHGHSVACFCMLGRILHVAPCDL